MRKYGNVWEGMGGYGRVWEGMGSGQSPLQPVDAPLLRAIRWVMPPLAARTLSQQLAARFRLTCPTSPTADIYTIARKLRRNAAYDILSWCARLLVAA